MESETVTLPDGTDLVASPENRRRANDLWQLDNNGKPELVRDDCDDAERGLRRLRQEFENEREDRDREDRDREDREQERVNRDRVTREREENEREKEQLRSEIRESEYARMKQELEHITKSIKSHSK